LLNKQPDILPQKKRRFSNMTRTIKSGDTLSKIAKANKITLAQLLDANPKFKANPNKIKVGDVVIIPGGADEPATQPTPQPTPAPTQTPAPTPKPTPQPAPAGRMLGKLSEKFETGGRGASTVSGGQGDPGGVSYGSYQMTSRPAPGTAGRFVSQSDFPFRDRFRNLAPGSKEFSSAWKKLAAEQPEAFQAVQHEYIKRTHFDPLVAKIMAAHNLDVTQRSHTLQDVIWSTAVQHGPQSSIPNVVLRNLGIRPDNPDFDKRLIVGIYAERGRKRADGKLAHFTRASPAVQRGVANRFKTEQSDALKALAKE
jgi:LysM repeat protein